MPSRLLNWLDPSHLIPTRAKRAPLVLINGLAEQSESWFPNRDPLSRHFDVKEPEILVYDGDDLRDRIESGGDVTVEYLVERLARSLDQFDDRSPRHLVASSLGCQVAITYAVENPDRVSRLVLICPSGFHGDEHLPALDGVRRSRYDSLVKSVFHERRFASDRLVKTYERKFQDRIWKRGVIRTLRGTVGHSVGHLLPRVSQPTLMIWGADDQVLSDVPGAIKAAERIPNVRQVVIPRCGHAPQIERARLVNGLIRRFLKGRLKTISTGLSADRYLRDQARREPKSEFAAPAPLLRSPSQPEPS
ncbi:MAG: alpha/beta fold hydrolase [Actinomycetota bacterium]|nr:alpha/beta fold hydrolase [Actinomycetota bacterium]